MITQKIAERISNMKAFYHSEIISTANTDKIRSVACMCADGENNIYVACRETKNIVVFDSELKEIMSFPSGITPMSMAIIQGFIIIADVNEEKVALFTRDGQHQWTQSSHALWPSLRMVTVGMFNDGSARLLDLGSNTVYDLSLTAEHAVHAQAICVIQNKFFYEQKTGARSLCGLIKEQGKLYTFCDNALHSISNSGVLEIYVKMPVTLTSVGGVAFVANNIILLDNKNNSIFIAVVAEGEVNEFKTIMFDKEQGILDRMCVMGSYLYFSRKKSRENTCIEKVVF